MTLRRDLAAWAVGLALGLAGCASVAPPGEPRISGRLAIQAAATAEQPARGVNAGFDLVGTADEGELRLNNPLGLQVALARWRAGEAVLQTTDGERRFDGLDTLAREALGEPVPLQALPDWLRGRPWQGASAEITDQGFEQLGWQVDLSRWAEGFLSATRPAPPALTLRIRVDQGS